MKRYGLEKGSIIKNSIEVNKIFTEGRRRTRRHLALFSDDAQNFQVAFAASRKIGCGAKRNHSKRLIRELARRNQDVLPENKKIILLAKRGIDRQKFENLQTQFRELLLEAKKESK